MYNEIVEFIRSAIPIISPSDVSTVGPHNFFPSNISSSSMKRKIDHSEESENDVVIIGESPIGGILF